MSAIRSALVLLVTALVLSGCSHKLRSSDDNTKPTVNNQDLTYCNSDQTFVVVGTGLSPMVVNGATDDPDLEMPTVCLKPIADPEGGGEPTPTLDNCKTKEACGCRLDNTDVSWASQEEIRFTLHPKYGLTRGWYDVVIKNPDGTQASGTVRVKVLPGEMIVVFADPSIVYNGFAIEPTIYGSNLVDITKVSIRDQNFVSTPLSDIQAVGGHNSQIQATLGKDQATGKYDVVVEAANGCKAELAQGMEVTATLDPTLVSAIDPTFGWNAEDTSVTITGAGFMAIPRVYVSPVTASAGSVASPLASVAMKSDTTLTAVVPDGLPPGPYNVIVVNPDGRIGVLSNLPGATGDQGAFFVTASPPPVVDSISPLYVTNQAPVTVTIDGTGFNNPTVTLTCQGPTGGATTSPPATVAANPTATTFNATFDTTSLEGGTVCLVTVTNPDNAYFVFSAVGVSLPSANLNPMVAATDLSEARRAPAVAAGRATRSARFVYAIGGDDGTTGGAKNSVETTAMDVYGVPGAWFNQPVTLPGARTLSAVTRIGNFLYLLGGNDGTAATASVLRAEVLQAANAPKIVDVGARRPPQNPPDNLGPGVGPGIWYYRVSAVMGATDASNPGGETLASDPFVVDLRQRDAADTIRITLYWDAVPGAASYRVYRNITGGAEENVESVRLLKADIAAADLQYEDTAATPPGGDSPRPLGATGNWAQLPDMTTPREALGVAAGRDPNDVSGMTWYLYALGGRAGGALASTERLPVTIAIDAATRIESQSVGTWTAGANLSAPRSELTGFSVTHVEAIAVPVGTTYIYAGGGLGSSNVDAATITGGTGDLAWQTVKAMSPLRQGYAGVAGASFLFVFGGANPDGTDDSMAAAELSTPPDFVNWNNNGGARLVHPRYYAGSTVESAFIYLVGGISNGAVTNTTERTVL